MKARQGNLAAIAVVARGLRELLDHVAFVGGATVALYIDDAAAGDVRVTEDIDCVVELAELGDYVVLEDRLRQLGFSNAIEPGAPICRWHFRGLTVDVMPTVGSILGFSNRWYPEGMRNLRRENAAPDVCVSIFALPYFLASKLEAFKTRGKADWQASHDLEDVIAVLDGSSYVEVELVNRGGELRDYLRVELGRLLNHPDVDEIVAGHVASGPLTAARTARIKDLLKRVVDE